MIQTMLMKLFMAGTLATAHPAIEAGAPNVVPGADEDESIVALASTVPIDPLLTTKNCENYPHAVYCYDSRGHQNVSACFSTMCDAVAAGYTRCGKARGSCK